MSDNREEINLNTYYSGSGKKKYKKRKKPSKFVKWWKSLEKWKKITYSIIAGVLALLIVVGSVAAIYVNVVLARLGSDDDFSKLNSSDLGIENVIDENIFNIALFGIDSRKKGSFEGLSDSIMILSINKTDNTVKLVSIMRDSLVPIENKGKISNNKINSAYSLGGPTLAVKTLNSVFGLDISAYATVNFYGMADIIDAVGGIEIDVTQSEINDNNYGLNVYIAEQYRAVGKDPSPYYIATAGTQKVNGMQAVAYARLRRPKNAYGNVNDFGRTERQRVVLKKIMDKALAMDIATYPSLVKKLTPYVKTSLSNSQMLSLAAQLAKKPTLIQSRVPHDEYIINADYRGTGASSVYYNYKYAGKVLRAFIYDNITPEDYMSANGVDKTGWHGSSSSGGGKTSSVSQGSSSKVDDDDVSSEEEGNEIPNGDNENNNQNPNENENVSSNESTNSSSENQGNETPVTPPENNGNT
ncbi:MAG: LCP family protein, partial [Acutalibacteraceae bacterium]|nr:LCP family protein [Acutalibacteraceae bacterium]